MERSPRLLALDYFASLGHRSYRNPFLHAACGLFLSPLGITASYYELAITECARGQPSPLYVVGAKWTASSVGPSAATLRPLVDGAAFAEVMIDADLFARVRLKPVAIADDMYATSLSQALNEGLETRMNAMIIEAVGFLREFAGSALRTLADERCDDVLARQFLADPAAFTTIWAERLAAST